MTDFIDMGVEIHYDNHDWAAPTPYDHARLAAGRENTDGALFSSQAILQPSQDCQNDIIRAISAQLSDIVVCRTLL